ncbi:type II secretion system protein [Neptuniibacter halophilus]|uniref:type II secretion system protein n=1 Tax=Neptuniibacter halophilus TaxID=651666 RepID=UPI002573006F|nr:type II secretion system protein [Neptuniibacter halophilus]
MKPDMNVRPPKNQQGFTLLELGFYLAIAVILSAAGAKKLNQKMERRDFETLGNKIAEHSRAVAEWIVDQGGSAVPGARVGTDWLKSNADCGITTGGTVAYLPCSFEFTNYKYGADPTTTITNVAGVTTALTTWPAVLVAGQPKALGVGHAVRQAEADTKDSLKGVVTYTENNSGVMTATVDVNNGTGIYVKRSGDTMTGALDMQTNNISNVGVLTGATGDFTNIDATNVDATNVTSDRYEGVDIDVTGSIAADGNITTTQSLIGQIALLNGNQTVGSACTNKQIGTTAAGDLVSCVGGVWTQPGSGGSATLIRTGTWSGTNAACTNVLAPAGTDASTHDIYYFWSHVARWTWEKTHQFHGTGSITSGNSKYVCGSTYNSGHGSQSKYGYWISFANPK